MIASPEILCERIARFKDASRIRGKTSRRALTFAIWPSPRARRTPPLARPPGQGQAYAMERMPVYLFPTSGWWHVYHCGPAPDGINPRTTSRRCRTCPARRCRKPRTR